nr:uncharacterized protein LOC111757946 [Cavia porcellus]
MQALQITGWGLLWIENQPAEHLAEVSTMSTMHAGGPYTGKELLEPAFLDGCPTLGFSFLDSSSSNISTSEALISEGSTPSLLDSSVDLSSEVDPPSEILDQLEPPEPPKVEPQIAGPAPGHAEALPAELEPAPPEAPSAELVSQQDAASGIPSQPDAELELLGDDELNSCLEFYQQVFIFIGCILLFKMSLVFGFLAILFSLSSSNNRIK